MESYIIASALYYTHRRSCLNSSRPDSFDSSDTWQGWIRHLTSPEHSWCQEYTLDWSQSEVGLFLVLVKWWWWWWWW